MSGVFLYGVLWFQFGDVLGFLLLFQLQVQIFWHFQHFRFSDDDQRWGKH